MEKQLTTAHLGDKVRVVSFVGGRRMQERLTSMGIHIGADIEITCEGSPGPYIVAVKDCRLAIGCGMAQKIMVLDE